MELTSYGLERKDNGPSAGIIIQNCLLRNGDYSKERLMSTIAQMTEHELKQFCDQIRGLQYFADTNQGAWATDRAEMVSADLKPYFWQLTVTKARPARPIFKRT